MMAKEKSTLLTTILGILLIVSSCITVILANENMLLRNQIAKINTVSSSTPTSQVDTSNWKIYTNQNLGYSLRFPGSYQLDDSNSNDVIFGYQSVMTARNGTVLKNVPYIEISSTYKTDFSKLTRCPQEGNGITPCIVGSDATHGEEVINNIKVDGKIAASVSLEDPDTPNIIIVQVSNPKLEITLFNINPVAGISEQTSNEILSTFQFTN